MQTLLRWELEEFRRENMGYDIPIKENNMSQDTEAMKKAE